MHSLASGIKLIKKAGERLAHKYQDSSAADRTNTNLSFEVDMVTISGTRSGSPVMVNAQQGVDRGKSHGSDYTTSENGRTFEEDILIIDLDVEEAILILPQQEPDLGYVNLEWEPIKVPPVPLDPRSFVNLVLGDEEFYDIAF